MTRGTVAEVIQVGEAVWFHVYNPRFLTVAVGIWAKSDLKSRCVDAGDTLWWQDDCIYWSPLGMKCKDIRLDRVRGLPAERPVELTPGALVG